MDKKERQKIANKKYRESDKGMLNAKKCSKKYMESDKGKEAKKRADKKYRETKNGIEKRNFWRANNHNKEMISIWKSRCIITDDWDNVYDVYINTTNCDYCNKKFKDNKDRHLDHDHSIKDDNNIRGILCCRCNTTDVLKGYPTIF